MILQTINKFLIIWLKSSYKKFFSSKNIFNQNSNSIGSNFNDIERHVVSEQLPGNDYLNATNEETYSNTISTNRQRQVTI